MVTTRAAMDENRELVDKRAALNLIQKLCRALNDEGVVYCHWKSNAALDRSATGDNDLDLLVSRSHVQLFTEILYRLGFKEARVREKEHLPGVLDYHGYDRDADKLVHVHAHYQLILGDDMTKNYRLPIEKAFLASAFQGTLFKIPTPEFEFIVFVIRMVLKHSAWDAILGRQSVMPASARRELDYLQSRVQQASTYEILQQHVPFVDAKLFHQCVRSLRPGCPIWTRVRVAQRLQNTLQAHARRSQVPDTYLKLGRRGERAVRRRIFMRLPGKRFSQGGALIAIVGGDGAGKSTAVNDLYKWLSKDFETIRVHMGKPAWSWTTIIVRGCLKLGSLLRLFPYTRASTHDMLDQKPPVFPGYPSLLREVCTARDRYLTYVKARRFAINGTLVLCDRFPLPQIKLMDGAQLERMTETTRTSRLLTFLIKLERKYYQSIVPPELLIILRVDPDLAVQRKTEEDPLSVRVRGKEIWELDWGQTPAHVIDASQPRSAVLSELKALIWSEL